MLTSDIYGICLLCEKFEYFVLKLSSAQYKVMNAIIIIMNLITVHSPHISSGALVLARQSEWIIAVPLCGIWQTRAVGAKWYCSPLAGGAVLTYTAEVCVCVCVCVCVYVCVHVCVNFYGVCTVSGEVWWVSCAGLYPSLLCAPLGAKPLIVGAL